MSPRPSLLAETLSYNYHIFFFIIIFFSQALRRKKGNNLATVELSEVLSREKLRGVTMLDTEHLITLAVAMQKVQEKEWLETYETIGDVRQQLLIFLRPLVLMPRPKANAT